MPNQDLRNDTEEVFVATGKLFPTDKKSLAVAVGVSAGAALARWKLFDGERLSDLANIAPFVVCLGAPMAADHFALATSVRAPDSTFVANGALVAAFLLMPDLRGWLTKAKYGLVVGALYALVDGWASAAVILPPGIKT